MQKKVLLLIMDGWGLAPADKFNAIANAKTPNFDKLIAAYPNTKLKADGSAVGLPEGQFGTSEVNHLTIGTGRIILQDLPRINTAIENGSFFTNPALNKTISHVADHKSNLHLVGILSDGGVHCMIEHIFALFDLLAQQDFKQSVYLHLFTDGRDVAPKSAAKYFEMLDKAIAKHKNINIKISTIQGRYFLDRDRDWAKTEKAFDLMHKGSGEKFKSWETVVNYEYTHNRSDEYFNQYLIDEKGLIGASDGVIFYHYRTDRLYQIVKKVVDSKINDLSVTTFIGVSEEFSDVEIAFPREKIEDTLAETLSKAGKKQLHVTETEKFAHLTFFLNGEKEKEMVDEEWKMIESNRFIKPYYNFEPSMRNFDIAKEILAGVAEDKYDFIVANFSSADMVGHTGSYEAAVISAEAVDYCLGKIYEAVEPKLKDYAVIVTADHGNSDIMWDYENNQPHTQHTLSPVPFILISDLDCKLDPRESLSDIAPTILDLMGIKKPSVMTGESLIIKSK